MAIDNQGPTPVVDATGNSYITTISPFGEVSTTNDSLRRIQEISMLMQQSQLLSIQLSNDKTGKYNFVEIR